MSTNEKDKTIEVISSDSIACIESVGEGASEKLRNFAPGGARSLAAVNTFTDTRVINRIDEISDSERTALRILSNQPVIARVDYVDEDYNEGTIFITRGTPSPNSQYKVAGLNGPMGRIASIPVGEDFTLRTPGKEREVTIISSTKLFPKKTRGDWDSIDSQLDIETFGKFTIHSLREYLAPQVDVVDEDLLAKMLEEDEEPNLREGIRRAVLSQMELRDQPILDQFQDEIFRLPINSQCFLSGPPGTGKTTTLIRRLGQKTDLVEGLEINERKLVETVKQETGSPHHYNWIMFSPTELLRQYVKEAFAREGFAASDNHIHTWDKFRRDLARNYFKIVRTGTSRGQFVERANTNYLDLESITENICGWSEDFEQFVAERKFNELSADADWLASSGDSSLARIGNKLKQSLKSLGAKDVNRVAIDAAQFRSDLDELRKIRRSDIDRIINRTVGSILKEDRNFLDDLAKEIERQQTIFEQYDVLDEADDDLDLADSEEEDGAIGKSVSRKEALSRYEAAVRAQARANSAKRKLSQKSRNGQLVEWLGETRLPSAEELEALSKIATEQSKLRKLSNLDNLLIRGISQAYKRFRRERADQSTWYSSLPENASDISWQELDILLLSMLRASNQILNGYRKAAQVDLPQAGILESIRTLHKAQVLIDEATDFSPVQLACMYEISHPEMRSFFACGDINQRVTEWGIKTKSEFDWVAPNIDQRQVTVSYRQTAKLIELAERVAILGGSPKSDTVLPDRVDNEGIAPVWMQHLNSDVDRAEWLVKRIGEIENIVGKVPTIAVLVNDETQVESLALELDKRLQEMSLSAVACKDGQVVGNDNDVRVFNVSHIKGLEFEAVFFVGLDKTIDIHENLWTKYLYVGATRAATYLGITFDTDTATQISSLTELFVEDWDI